MKWSKPRVTTSQTFSLGEPPSETVPDGSDGEKVQGVSRDARWITRLISSPMSASGGGYPRRYARPGKGPSLFARVSRFPSWPKRRPSRSRDSLGMAKIDLALCSCCRPLQSRPPGGSIVQGQDAANYSSGASFGTTLKI